jgi:hypothetical protein
MAKKKLLVSPTQLQYIFEHKILMLMETVPPEGTLPTIISLPKEVLINMMDDLNYEGSIKFKPASAVTDRRKKIIQISNEQLNKLVTKLLLIKNTLDNGGHVEGYSKDWVYYPDQYQRMPSFGKIVSP